MGNGHGAQRLTDGNTFLTYSPGGAFVPVTADGTEVWRYVKPFTVNGELGPTTRCR